jgi:hypothetical protein
MKRRGNVISPIDSINTVVEMLQQTDSSVEDGEIVWVRSAQCLFVYRVNGGLAPDGVNVVASLYGNGVWQRQLASSNVLGQTAWFISEAGLSSNSGLTASSPITELERQARWGRTAQSSANTTVTYLDTPSVICNYDWRNGPEAANLTITGVTTQAKTGTITVVTALNRGTQTPWSITGTGLGAADVGKIIRITAGARVGAYARIAKDLGANAVRISPFGTASLTSFQGFTPVTPQVNDPFEVLNLITLQCGTMRFSQGSNLTPYFPSTGHNVVNFDLITIDGGSAFQGSLNSENITITLTRGIYKRLGLAGPYGAYLMLGGGIDGLAIVAGPICFAFGGACVGSSMLVFQGASINVDYDFLFQAGQVVVGNSGFGGGPASMVGGNVAFFDAAFDGAFSIESGSTYQSTNENGVGDLLWGTANAGHGVRVRSFGGFLYTTKPTINGGLGAGRELLAGGVDTLWAAVPIAAMPANGATVQVRA